ncbi:MAG TPA: hypothetical protein DEQ64_02990 [Lachnoclostridium sp.]|jgi:hypothetical protein|uniref:hypothetical protein n=1 Tax=Lacrimispora sp. TaxID=2719234 RepID=UPI000EE08D8E|nr:hypothetical protein [Lacrimispora sp.]HCD42703.1 hypothetical protein [Lachnoclostridium sp.]
MEQINHEYHMEGILIKGRVRYKDSCPVKGAVVILEKLVPIYNQQEQGYEGTCLEHTMTNDRGEFCFSITDKMSSYKIKVFDNHHR